MSLLTTFFNLIKPAKTDGVKVSDFNANMDTIDTEMHRPPLTVNAIAPDSSTRNLTLTEVPLAGNLSSDIAQIVNGDFIERTSGGDASIEDGDAFLTSIKGNMTHTGYVAESIEMTVNATDEDAPITATIDRDTFVSAVSESGTTTLSYTSSWSSDPATYGVTVTGTPVNGDSIVIVYVKENRGTITPAAPTSFNSTGWNLFDVSAGYAKVVKYSDEYGYLLGGNYSLISFATTPTGTQSALTVSDGLFNVPSDGYVIITGGDATTYITPTWTDWVDGYDGEFESYTVDTIDLTEVMLNFPYGLLAVGETRDEINFNAQKAIHRVERLAYTAENLADVIESGVSYVADTNYIYAALSTPTTADIDIDGAYSVSDHGIEYYTGTTVPLVTETLYGENLKDKLRTDVVTLSAQSLTSTQKAQVRTNIGAASASDLTSLSNKFAWQTYLSASNVSVGNTYASTGKSFTLTKPAIVQAGMSFGTGRPLAIGIKNSQNTTSTSLALTAVVNSDIADTSGLTVTAILAAGTYYIWARTASASGSTNLTVQGMTIGA